jgi:two-component system response regulator GlrR
MDLNPKRHRTVLPPHDGRGMAGARPRPDTAAVSRSGATPARILVVEDQEDVRRMVATALEIEGYQVVEASNAQEGLRRLREGWYHLVLSDYAMPGGTGTWMLQEAGKLGLMRNTIALIVTAHPDVRELADVAVINKPLDLDSFLEQIRLLVATSRGLEGKPVDRTGPHLIELVLYISSTSSASIQARQNLEVLFAGFDMTRVKFSVVDLLRDPTAGVIDRVAFTPTLVKRTPGPRTWILGNLRDAGILADLLIASGIPRIEVAR